MSISHFDPELTFVAIMLNALKAGFYLYPSTCSNRYDAGLLVRGRPRVDVSS